MKRYKLPKKASGLTPYQPLIGDYRIRLDANESFLEVPQWLRQEITSALSEVDFRRYPDPEAKDLCAGFANFYGVRPEQVVAGSGSDELIGLLVSWFLDKGQKLVTVLPDFGMYAFYAQTIQAEVVVCQKDKDDLTVSLKEVAETVRREQAKLLIFSNPCNPTAQEAEKDDIEALLREAPEDCLVVVDEAYMEFGQESVMSLLAEYENLVVLKTCSKAFGMAGIRLGFAVASEAVSSALRGAKSPFNVNVMTQRVGEVLFAQPAYLSGCVERIRQSRDKLYKLLVELSRESSAIRRVYPTRANFVLVLVDGGRQVYEALLRQGIALRCFGDALRITAGSDAENAEVVRALGSCLQKR